MESFSQKYVITGGPGVGKTTLLSILSSRGYSVMPEIARAVMEEQIAKNSDVLPWRNFLKFQEVVAWRQLEGEEKLQTRSAFLDRGLVDGYAYCAIHNIRPPALILRHAPRRYSHVFLLAPLPEYENDGIRREDSRLAAAIHHEIASAYKRFGYLLTDIPVLPSPHDRADMVLDLIRFHEA